MKLRRSMLFVPGNNPGIIRDVHIYKPDSVMFDLEDAIAITEKDSARFLVHNMLKNLGDYYKELGIETVVRINGLATEFWQEDIAAVVSAGVEVVRIPMTESVEDVMAVDAEIEKIEKACGEELFAARGMIAMAGRACGLEVLDTVYADVNNDEGFLKEANLIKTMGFGGKSLIHPRQVELIHDVYTPSEKEIAKAQKIVDATAKALEQNLGVFTVDGKMVDKPIIERAQRVLQLAEAAGVLVGGEF